MEKVLASPDSTPLDLSPSMGDNSHDDLDGGGGIIVRRTSPKLEPALDLDRVCDREAVALAMVRDLGSGPCSEDGQPRRASVTGSGTETEDERTTTSQGGRPIKHRKRPRDDEKICRVCGDKALAHNFDVITCESCKAFFRRNALKPERMECMFTGECQINTQTRRFCPACRLHKCFNVGMKAQLILDDRERKARMTKVTENRAKRVAKEYTDSSEDKVGSTSHTATPPVKEETYESPCRQHDLTQHVLATPSPPAIPVCAANLHPFNHHPDGQVTHPLRPPQQLQQGGQGYEQRLLQAERTVDEVGGSAMNSIQGILMSTPVSVGFSQSLAVPGLQRRLSSTSLTSTTQPQPLPLQPPSEPQGNPNTANYALLNPTKPYEFDHKPQDFQHQPQEAFQHQFHQHDHYFAQKTHNFQQKSSDFQDKLQDFQHVPRDLLPSDPHMYWRLSEEEKTLLTQLSSAYQDTVMTLPERVHCDAAGLRKCLSGESPTTRSMESVFESSEKNMQLLVAFVQKVGDFHHLRDDDKMAILQASGMRSVILRWTALFVVERNTWLTRYGECDVSKAAVVFGHEGMMQEMASFCRSLKTLLKNDVTLFVLMHCLVLFDPREHNLVDRQAMNVLLDKYVILLKHYLESEYSFLYMERYLRAILDKTVELRHLAERSLAVVKEFREFVPPLMKQVLNLQTS